MRISMIRETDKQQAARADEGQSCCGQYGRFRGSGGCRPLFLIGAIVCLTLGGCQEAQETGANGSGAANAASNVQTEVSDTEAVPRTSDSEEFFAMDTFIELRAYGENCTEALAAAKAEVERLDAMLSTGNADSEVAKLNRTGKGTLSSDALTLLEESLRLADETDGAFDIAIYPMMEAWGFTGENPAVPKEETIEALLPLCDVSLINHTAGSSEVSFQKEGVQIDFGGIAKGYTSAKLVKLFEEYRVSSAYIDLGGNIQTLGTKTDGTSWKIGISDPDDPSEVLGILETHDEAVITSGGYERYFEEDGTSYHHIIDPTTGHPANNGLVSVTIVTPDGMLADGLSTSLYIMGTEKAIAFCKEHQGEFDAVLMDEDGAVYVTDGIASRFNSEYPVTVIAGEPQ